MTDKKHHPACPAVLCDPPRACECENIAEGIIPLTPEFFFGNGSKTMRLGGDWMKTGLPARPAGEEGEEE